MTRKRRVTGKPLGANGTQTGDKGAKETQVRDKCIEGHR